MLNFLASTPVGEPKEMRELILKFEHELTNKPEHHIEIETTHHFAPGVYAREVFVPAGTVVVGKIHKTEHLNIISKGEITVWTESGMKRLKAPFTLLSKPGTKRIGYAHEDTVWTTIHPTEETDLEKLEEQLIAKTFAEVPFIESVKLEGKK